MAGEALIGRSAERSRLDRHLDAAIAGDASVVAVTGPAGIGKTALADAGAQAGTERGLVVHWGACWEGPGAPSLWPWIQVVRSLGEPWPDADHDFALFDAVTRAVLRAADTQPVLLVLDDLHAADVASVQLLDFLLRQRRGHRLAVIATFRQGEAPPDLSRALRDADQIPLTGLSSDEVGRLAATAGDLGSIPVDRLAAVTGGNPFFVLEVTRSLGVDPGGEVLTIPDSVLDVVEQALDPLPSDVRETLTVAAVLGRSFEVEAVAAVVGTSIHRVQAALDRAVQVGLVQRHGSGIRFVHALTADAVLRSLSNDELESIHLSVADHVGDPEAAAAHLMSSGDRCDPERMVSAARLAATAALAQHAASAAARHLAAAVEGARRLDDRGLLADVLVDRCWALAAARDLGAARSSALEAAAIAREAGDRSRLAAAAIAMPPHVEGIEVDQLADPDQILLREEALAQLPDDDVLAARLMAGLARSLYWVANSGDRALDHRATATRRDQLTAVAVERARRAGDDATLGHCLAARIGATYGPDAPSDVSACTTELIEVADRLADGPLRQQALAWSAVDAMRHGDHDRAVGAVAAHGRLAEVRRDQVARWTTRRWEAGLALSEGRLADAERLALEALVIGEEAVDPVAAALFYVVPIGFSQFLQGRLGESFDYVRAQAEDPGNVPAWRSGYVSVAFAAGHLDLAASELRLLAADRFGALPRDLDWWSALVGVAPAVAAVGDPDVARTMIELLESHADEHAVVGLGYVDYGPVRRAIGLARSALGDTDGAISDLQRCIDDLHPAQAGLRDMCRRDLDALVGGAPPRTAALRPNEGTGWSVQLGEGPLHALRGLRGFALLRELLDRRDDVSPLDLLWTVEPPDADPGEVEGTRRAVAAEFGDPVIDETALAAYRRRLAELDVELAAADRAGSAERSEAAATERHAIEAEIRRTTGLSGRSRRSPDAAERARTSVTKLLRRAIDAVAAVEPELGRHLRASVQTGSACRYEPAPDDRYRWDLG